MRGYFRATAGDGQKNDRERREFIGRCQGIAGHRESPRRYAPGHNGKTRERLWQRGTMNCGQGGIARHGITGK